MISNSYPQIAFCLAITPAQENYYSSLKKMDITTVSICLYISKLGRQKHVTGHVNAARNLGMTTHAYMITDLHDPINDCLQFSTRFLELGYSKNSKITVFVNGSQYIEDSQKKINDIIKFLSKFHKRENIDLAFFNDDLNNKIYNLDLLPEVNLTLANVNSNTPGSSKVGTWIYTMDCGENSQFLAYHYYGYYTEESYQLPLIDSEYVVQQGDSWYSIARRHDIPLIKLLKMNEISSESRVYEGQVVKIA